MSSLSKNLLIIIYKVRGIVKVVNIIPPISFKAISSLANEIFNHIAPILFTVYLLNK